VGRYLPDVRQSWRITLPLANRLFGWAVKHKHLPWIRQIPNALSMLRVWAPATSARAIRAYRRRDWQAFALWSTLTLVLIAIDALDGPVAELLDARSRAGAYIDSTMDKFAFLRILRQLHVQLRTHEQGMEAFLSGLAVSWRTYLDLGLQAASTEASLRGFNNRPIGPAKPSSSSTSPAWWQGMPPWCRPPNTEPSSGDYTATL
jgi:hypothetical protein